MSVEIDVSGPSIKPKWIQWNDTRFKIKPMPQLNIVDIYNGQVVRPDGTVALTSICMRAAIEHGLMDWEKVNDQNGEPLPCNLEFALKLPHRVLEYVASEIMLMSVLKEDDRKKS